MLTKIACGSGAPKPPTPDFCEHGKALLSYCRREKLRIFWYNILKPAG
jgi:hypothetical protein